MTSKTPGQLAYEADVMIDPLYSDGTPRKRWGQLDYISQHSWELNPTVRAAQPTRQGDSNAV